MGTIRDSLRREGKQFRELVKLFFRKFLENDLICLEGDTSSTLINILALVAAPGVFFPVLENFIYGPMYTLPLWVRDLHSLPEKGLYLSFSMTVLGILVVLEWDTLLPDRRDYNVLQPFPLRLGTILTAKIAALAGLWAVFTVAVNAFSTIIFPMVVVQTEDLRSVAWFARGHALAVLAGNAFVFLALISLQGLLMNVLGWRWFRRVSPYAQGLLITALLLMFFSSASVTNGITPGRPLTTALRLFPPAWFIGFYQTELGWKQPLFRELAAQALTALAAAGLTGAAAFTLSYKRHVSRSLELTESSRMAPGRLRRAASGVLNTVFLRTAGERASFHFVVDTMLRSRNHRSVLCAWAGVGFALVGQTLAAVIASGSRTWWQSPQGVLLPVPIVLSLFLLCGMRHMFAIPAELGANWLFRVSGRKDSRDYLPGVRKAVLVVGILPLYALLLPVHIAIWGWTAASLHIVFGCTVAWLLMEVLLAGFAKLPFTCSYVPGKANIKALWPVYTLAFLAYVSSLSGFELWILREPSRMVWLFVFAAVCKAGVLFYRRRLRPEDLLLVFDERPEPVVRTLDLMQP
ncbi:MAG: hypothetical protein ACM336_11100 [Acidobacteriota bacterium]